MQCRRNINLICLSFLPNSCSNTALWQQVSEHREASGSPRAQNSLTSLGVGESRPSKLPSFPQTCLAPKSTLPLSAVTSRSAKRIVGWNQTTNHGDVVLVPFDYQACISKPSLQLATVVNTYKPVLGISSVTQMEMHYQAPCYVKASCH